MLTGRARTFATTTLAILITFGASGCFAPTETPESSASATPSASPLFASDEEALAAATEAYAAYLAAIDRSGQGGWLDSSELKAMETEEAFFKDVATAKRFSSAGYKQIGSSSFDSMELQRLDSSTVTTYLCLDVTEVDVIDPSGVSIVDESQPRRLPLEVSFTPSDESSTLLIEGSEIWSGENFC